MARATPSAYSHARQKLKPEVFTHLNRSLWTGFSQLAEADDEVQRWRGHRLLGTDGTFLTLPDTPETRAKYTVQTNQHAGADCVQTLCCVLYDLRNELGLRLHLSARQGEVRTWRDSLWRATQPGAVLGLDRAYADDSLLALAQAQRRHLIVRLPRGRFAECEACWASSLPEQIARAGTAAHPHHTSVCRAPSVTVAPAPPLGARPALERRSRASC